MPSYKNVIDNRPFKRSLPLLYKYLQDAYTGLQELVALGRVLLNDDGTPNSRNFARLTGTYTFGGGVYNLVKQGPFTNYLPATITLGGTGICVCAFTTTLPESTYELHVAPGKSSSSAAVTWHFDPSLRTATQCVFYTFVNGVLANLDGLSITILYG